MTAPLNPHDKDVALLERIAQRAADKAVADTLTRLGIDPSDPISAQHDFAALREVRKLVESREYQADLMHLRTWRKSMEGIRTKGVVTIIGLVVTGLAAAVWIGLKQLAAAGGPT